MPLVLFYIFVYCYFFIAQNNAHNQPIPVQPKTQLARRINNISYLDFFVWRASQAGAKIIATIIVIAAIYFKTIKKSNDIFILFR